MLAAVTVGLPEVAALTPQLCSEWLRQSPRCLLPCFASNTCLSSRVELPLSAAQSRYRSSADSKETAHGAAPGAPSTPPAPFMLRAARHTAAAELPAMPSPPLPDCLPITLRFCSRFSPRASLEKQHGDILADLAKIQPQRPQATQNEASMRNSRNGMMSARGRRMSTAAGLEGMAASAGHQGAMLRGLFWPARLKPQG